MEVAVYHVTCPQFFQFFPMGLQIFIFPLPIDQILPYRIGLIEIIRFIQNYPFPHDIAEKGHINYFDSEAVKQPIVELH